MVLNIFKRPFNEFSSDKFVRFDADYYRLIQNVKDNLRKIGLGCEELRENITHLETGKPITRKDYSSRPTGFIHLVVRNIEGGQLDLEDPIYLREEKGKELERHRLRERDLVLAISSNVGDCFLYDGSFEEIQFTLSHYLTKSRFNEGKVVPEFLLLYLNSSIMRNYFRACETGKTQMNLSKQYLYELPFPEMDQDAQFSITEKIGEINDKIEELKKTIPNTQEVIEKVFYEVLGYVPSKKYVTKGSTYFRRSFHQVSRGKYVRLGAKYNFFWNKYEGLLFETDRRYDIFELEKLMKPYKTEMFKKGYLKRKYILIDKEDIEPKTGVIWNEEYVDKIESNKITFEDCDILISKIDPFLGHVILNDKEKPYIGTTELVPYKINDDTVDLNFLQYILLSKNFLELSEKIMAGKRQPRISPYELLKLKIPCPPKGEQRKAVEQIKGELGDLKRKKFELHNVIQERDKLFLKCLAQPKS